MSDQGAVPEWIGLLAPKICGLAPCHLPECGTAPCEHDAANVADLIASHAPQAVPPEVIEQVRGALYAALIYAPEWSGRHDKLRAALSALDRATGRK